ncbi:polysaccharide deacetylase family protein [Alkalihalobacillus sp. MEB130]|uniref:polysaccharide deacetylase family protein n=1 Tax=Alkalihalobacillus sp. MEB130 TaxID=2976704 RepID=UPI0028DD8649|nr:polysaccharide deacetylase family protein [Alkalihalobacillus sp. MEB130]MDT8860933.1 polysaccharide deacetylase family protein [Alkalihalobacillus sp. MEB130]
MKWFQILLLLAVISLKACGVETSSDISFENEREEQSDHEQDFLAEDENGDSVTPSDIELSDEEIDLIEFDLSQFEDRKPKQWGEKVDGVKTHMVTDEKVIALTFDACGGPYGNGYDEELIAFLRQEQVPATLFINERWIIEHEELFLNLANDPLFQIENHGTAHVPLSVTGKSAWGIDGTLTPEEVKEEVLGNQHTIQNLTGQAPTLFRSGTAFYDEVAVEIVQELGLEVVNFDVLGDAGATFSATEVHQAISKATSGSIVLLHMNQPQSGTAEGVKMAVQDLREKGYEFVTLDYASLK